MRRLASVAALLAASPAWAAAPPDQAVFDLGRLAGSAVLCGVSQDRIQTVMAIGLGRTGAELGSPQTKQRFLAGVDAGKAAIVRQGTAGCSAVRTQLDASGAPSGAPPGAPSGAPPREPRGLLDR